MIVPMSPIQTGDTKPSLSTMRLDARQILCESELRPLRTFSTENFCRDVSIPLGSYVTQESGLMSSSGNKIAKYDLLSGDDDEKQSKASS